MFPLGNGNERGPADQLSLYLDFAGNKENPPNWHRCVQFSIRICNPEDPKTDMVRGMKGLLLSAPH